MPYPFPQYLHLLPLICEGTELPSNPLMESQTFDPLRYLCPTNQVAQLDTPLHHLPKVDLLNYGHWVPWMLLASCLLQSSLCLSSSPSLSSILSQSWPCLWDLLLIPSGEFAQTHYVLYMPMRCILNDFVAIVLALT